jgi:hypothetical protein
LVLGIVSFLQAGAAAANDGMNLVLGFEARSTRLTASDTAGLDRLAETLAVQTDNHLVVFVPWSKDPAFRRFILSRLASVQQELSNRGVAGDIVKVPRDDETIVLWIAPRVLPNTPIEMLPETLVSPSLPEASPKSGNDIAGTPIALLPGDEVVKTEKDTNAMPSSLSSQNGVPVSDAPSSPVPAESQSPASADLAPEEMWTAAVGQSLRTVLVDWGLRAGWTIIWQSDREYPVDATATFSGDFVKAAEQLFDGFSTVTPAPSAHVYKGNRVLLVESGEGR